MNLLPKMVQFAIDEVYNAGMKPYIEVDPTVHGAVIPEEAIGPGGTALLNLGMNAIKYYNLENGVLSFEMGIQGRPVTAYVPLEAVLTVVPDGASKDAVQIRYYDHSQYKRGPEPEPDKPAWVPTIVQ